MGRRKAQHVPSAEQLARDRKVLELRQAGWSFTRIAEHEDVRLHDRGSAHKAYKRALSYVMAEPAAEVRELENTRLDRLLEAVWTKAMDGNLDAVHTAIRVGERRAKLLGLDHADGIAERQLALESERVALVAVAFGRALDVLAGHVALDAVVMLDDGPTTLRALVTRVLLAELRANTDDVGNVVDEEGRTVLAVGPGPATGDES